MPRQSTQEKPQRSCLACREAREKHHLIRFVLSPEGEVLPDLEARLPGRGAYTCISSRCLHTAVKQHLFNRAFKRQVLTQSPDEMSDQVANLMRERILGYLGLANRAGKIISGSSLVCDSIRGKIKPGLIVVASDASESISDKVLLLAGIHMIHSERVLTKADFGAILGKAPRSAVAIRQGGFIARLVGEIERYRNFLGEV